MEINITRLQPSHSGSSLSRLQDSAQQISAQQFRSCFSPAQSLFRALFEALGSWLSLEVTGKSSQQLGSRSDLYQSVFSAKIYAWFS